ncbi:hypothetical protein G5S34_22520 [Herbaspirillum frisingense]|uniref:hypothetical protein n=1 Tax=Herbaspirillum frisingense TaxID=92645 RepID=UPI0016016022|nr:hypothetical protein [Herbaspirillum frisingense]QNB09252.1 hypothetical protein G5S34_22520 [Herbaspirillum frisingense]
MLISDRIILLSGFLTVCTIGLASFFTRRQRIPERIDLVSNFLSKLKEYISSVGNNHEAYGWLLHRSHKMQRELGLYGIYASYSPPYSGRVYVNYPIILNMLPEMRKAFEDDYLARTQLGYQYGAAIQETIIRYAGALADQREELDRKIRNPVIWFREGIRILMALPISIIGWLGAMSERTVSSIVGSRGFALVTAFASIIGFLSAVIGIALGWEQFNEMVLRWLKIV